MNKDLQTIKKNLDYFRSLAFDCDEKQLGDILVEEFETVEKKLKALDIMCSYNVEPADIIMRTDYKSYMYGRTYQEGFTLSKEQWEFLKEVLENE